MLRGGDRIRISVELIETLGSANAWAESYEAQYSATALFEIHSDVATSVADALAASLTDEERTSIADVPTENITALERYNEGVALRREALSATSLRRAVARFRGATEEDPAFADAWADLAEGLLFLYHNYDNAPEHRDEASRALARADSLAPDNPRVRMARGLFHYRVEADFEQALAELVVAQRGLPNDPDIISNIALVQRRVGRGAEAATAFTEALELDPRNSNIAGHLAVTWLILRDFDEAVAAYEYVLDLEPGDDSSLAGLGLAELSDDPGEARRILRRIQPNRSGFSDWMWWLLATALGEHELILDQLGRLAASELTHQASLYPLSLVSAWSHDALGNERESRELYAEASDELTTRLDQSPHDGRLMAALGLALAGQGRSAEAIEMGRQALVAEPFRSDRYLASIVREDLARMYAMSGEPDAAFATLDTLLAEPGYLSRAQLAGSWMWKDLRADPRFARLTR